MHSDEKLTNFINYKLFFLKTINLAPIKLDMVETPMPNTLATRGLSPTYSTKNHNIPELSTREKRQTRIYMRSSAFIFSELELKVSILFNE